MRLLLLISAFLTAMVGVGTPAAAAARPACEVSATATIRTERVAPQIAALAARAHGHWNSANLSAAKPANAPARTVPLYAERLRV